MSHPKAHTRLSLFLSKGLRARNSSSRGSALLYVIASIVLLGTIGGGVAYFSSSSSTSQLTQTRAEQAYYAALAGQGYVVWQHKNFAEQNKETIPKENQFSEFLSLVNNGGASQTLDGNRRFAITATATPALCQYCYTASIDGKYIGSDGLETESFHIASVGVGGIIDPFVPKDAEEEDDEDEGNADEMSRMTPEVSSGSRLDTGVYGKSVKLGDSSYVKGDVISLTTVEVGSSAAVGGDVCAGGNVTLNNQASVGGDINTPGNVTIGSNAATVKGSVFAGGTVTLNNTAQVLGEIHAGGKVTLGSNASSSGGTIRSNGDVELGQQCLVSGNAHSGGSINNNGGTINGSAWARYDITVNTWNNAKILGSTYKNSSVPPRELPTSPTACAQVKKPPLKTFSVGTLDISTSWGQTKDISPGAYGTLSVGGNNVVTFQSGTYYFKSISTGYNTTFRFDVSGGDVVIFVKGNVTFGSIEGVSPVKVSIEGTNYEDMSLVDKAHARKIYLETHEKYESNNNSRWFGTILAKKGIKFGGNELPTGTYNLIGAMSTVDDDAKIELSNKFKNYYVKSNYAKNNW